MNNQQNQQRRGTVLIIVVGIAVMLVALVTSFFMWMRRDSESSNLLIQEAQARAMLHAAVSYVQEGSMLGWAPNGTAATQCFGWTDIRDGSLGPRPPRPASSGANISPIPVPSWWSGSVSYQAFPTDSQLPPASARQWPCPGSSVRVAMAAWKRPPYAIEPIMAANPIRPPLPYGDSNWNTAFETTVPTWQRRYATPGDSLFTFGGTSGALGMLDPQPVANTYTDFRDGDRTIKAGTDTRGWFRVYRELLTDHDGDGRVYRGADTSASTVPWAADTVALYDARDPAPNHKNWNVFIITCGAGPTQGFRFYDKTDPGWSYALEPVTASQSGLFADRAMFEDLRARERLPA
jgi:hypothetical protein